jgi:DinB superfamily
MRPEPNEYAENYANYIAKVEGGNILDTLQTQMEATMALLKTADEAKGDFRYESSKWNVKELVGHIIDTERVFAYRALVFARNDSISLPGFDQESWARNANFQNLRMRDLITEFESVRLSSILLFGHLDAAAWLRRGIGNNKEMTVRAAAFVIAGHTQHHVDILKSRYLL